MRISKVTTRTGDKGKTRLGDGQEVSKSDLRIQVLGELDELNSLIGWTLVAVTTEQERNQLQAIQNDLMNLAGEASIPEYDKTLLPVERILFLEQTTEAMNNKLPALKEFILPGGDEFAARIHLTRAVCRRAERSIVALTEHESGKEQWLLYLNRLSDYLFVLARYHNFSNKNTEQFWNKRQ